MRLFPGLFVLFVILQLSLQAAPLNQRPVAGDDTITLAEDQIFTFSVLENDADPDGSLDRSSIRIVKAPLYGELLVHADGQLTFEPKKNWYGQDQCTYAVADNSGKKGKAKITFIVEPVNDPPLVKDENAVAVHGHWSIFDILLNDTDEYDPEGQIDPARSKITMPPQHGSADADAITGEIRYKPNAGYTGADKLKYRVCDDQGACDTATLFITVRMDNTPPVAVADIAEGEGNLSLDVNVLANDYDPDGSIAVNSLTLHTLAANGYAQVKSGGIILYHPDPGWCGTDYFDYRICDQEGACVIGEVTVIIDCVEPVAFNDFMFTEEGRPASVNVLVNDESGTGALIPESIRFPMQPSHGEVKVNANNGTVTYTPLDAWCGDDRFSYEVCDQNSYCTEAAVSVKGLCYTFLVSNDVAVTTQETDIAVRVLQNDHETADPSTLQVLELPDFGSAVKSVGGVLQYFPPPAFTGEDCFTYRVYDFSGLVSGTAEVCITVYPETLEIPEVFTPNGDGINEVLYIKDLHFYPNNRVTVYDRDRKVVFQQEAYANDWNAVAEDGKQLPEGTYYIVVLPDFNDGNSKPVLGYTTIHR